MVVVHFDGLAGPHIMHQITKTAITTLVERRSHLRVTEFRSDI